MLGTRSSKLALSSSPISAGGNANVCTAARDIIVYSGNSQDTTDANQNDKNIWLDRLSTLSFKAIQRETHRKVAKNSGSWFINNSTFNEWKSHEKGVIWGRGIGGAGKTFLSSIVIDNLQRDVQASSDDAAVIFAYCRFERKFTSRDILASLLRQLCETSCKVYDAVRLSLGIPEEEQGGNHSEEDLLSALEAGVSLLSKVFIIVDALDELGDEERYRFIDAAIALPTLLFLTSRPIYIPNLDGMSTISVFEVRAQEDEVREYLRHELLRLPKLNGLLRHRPAVLDSVVSALEKKTEGMFLLARLQLNAMKNVMTVNQLLAIVQTLPSTISEMYNATLQRINEQSTQEQDIAYRALIWLSHSLRPLRVIELLYAIAVTPDCKALDENDLISNDTLLSICHGLISIEEESGAVSLSHYTALEFLSSRLVELGYLPDEEISEACSSYLGAYTKNGADWPRNVNDWSRSRSHRPLWNYACVHLGPHLKLARLDPSSGALPPCTQQLLENSKVLPLQSTETDYAWCDWGSGIHFAAKHGILPAFHWLTHSVAEGSRRGLTPLQLAAENGHLKIVEHLILSCDIGPNVNEVQFSNSEPSMPSPHSLPQSTSALARACLRGHKHIVAFLLKLPNINVNTTYRGMHILHTMIQHGPQDSAIQTEIIDLLLGHPGILIDTVDGDGQTVLHYVAKFGAPTAVVDLLLYNGSRLVDSVDRDGRRPASVAQTQGRMVIFQRFDRLQADVKCGDLSEGDASVFLERTFKEDSSRQETQDDLYLKPQQDRGMDSVRKPVFTAFTHVDYPGWQINI